MNLLCFFRSHLTSYFFSSFIFEIYTFIFCFTIYSQEIPLRNPSMTEGTQFPVGWEGKWGNIQVFRDTKIYKTPPASLRVKCNHQEGNVHQMLDLPYGNETFMVKGWCRTEGDVIASVGIQAFDQEWKQNIFLQCNYLQGNQDWQSFEKTITLPSWTSRFNIQLYVKGTGQAWIDDISIVRMVQPMKLGNVEVFPPPPGNPKTTPLPPGKPWIPGWCRWDWRAGWYDFHQSFVQHSKQNGDQIQIVFYGDSLTQGWSNEGKEFWDKFFTPLQAANYGIGGDSTRQLLYRILHGELNGLNPKLIVLCIGTNNLYDDANGGTNDEIAQAIGLCVRIFHHFLPETPILLCGLLPRQNDWFCNRIREINRIIAKLENKKNVYYLDVWDLFYDHAQGTPDRRVIPELFHQDLLHLSKKGYEVWGNALLPVIQKILNH